MPGGAWLPPGITREERSTLASEKVTESKLLKLREQAYQLLGQQAASLGTGGAGTGMGGETKVDGKK